VTIVNLFHPMPADHAIRNAKWQRTFPCDAWPLMPGQTAWFDYAGHGEVCQVCGPLVGASKEEKAAAEEEAEEPLESSGGLDEVFSAQNPFSTFSISEEDEFAGDDSRNA
jgi:hypothetical protein